MFIMIGILQRKKEQKLPRHWERASKRNETQEWQWNRRSSCIKMGLFALLSISNSFCKCQTKHIKLTGKLFMPFPENVCVVIKLYLLFTQTQVSDTTIDILDINYVKLIYCMQTCL